MAQDRKVKASENKETKNRYKTIKHFFPLMNTISFLSFFIGIHNGTLNDQRLFRLQLFIYL